MLNNLGDIYQCSLLHCVSDNIYINLYKLICIHTYKLKVILFLILIINFYILSKEKHNTKNMLILMN